MNLEKHIALKQLFLLDPEIIFLNHGSFGATPRPVFESYQRWQRLIEWQPVNFFGRKQNTFIQEARESLAAYLNTSADHLVYVTNATTGLNIVARSLPLSEKDEVLTTDHEYGALDKTWSYLSRQSGFKYVQQPVNLPIKSIDSFIDNLWERVTPRTRVIFISHITSPTAITFPVKEICARARKEGILTVIDGAHAPGQVDVDLQAINPDFYVGNCHKWLCAPKGSAFLFAHPSVQHLLQPLVVSWGWEPSNPVQPAYQAFLQQNGTRDISAFLTVPDAIQFQEANDWHEVREYCHSLTRTAQQEIAKITGLPPLHPDSSEWYSQMGTAELPSYLDHQKIHDELLSHHIEVPVSRWKDKNLIRFSFQIYNTDDDLRVFIDTLKSIISK
ncbi:MAG TPA: aminotransferase class V-fold PLP-dependent enzyme [Anaerolineaceae bacterium]